MPRNLVLVHHPALGDDADFHEVGRQATAFDRGIRAHVISDRRFRLGRLLLAARKTLVFSPIALQRLRPLRGRVFQGGRLPKSEELRRLEAAGLPVPRWSRLPLPDPEQWPPYLVVKPESGRRGNQVKLMRRGRAARRTDRDRIAQELVYTGPWPVSYRVTTLFGEVLWSLRFEAQHDRRPMPPPEEMADAKGGTGLSILATSRGSTVTLNHDEEILRLGERAHAAFPEHPLLGVDIVRERPSGALRILEVNSPGFTWHFSSDLGLGIQRDFGISLEGQFDGLRKAGRILAEKTRALAR